jgi:hypothetical protein
LVLSGESAQTYRSLREAMGDDPGLTRFEQGLRDIMAGFGGDEEASGPRDSASPRTEPASSRPVHPGGGTHPRGSTAPPKSDAEPSSTKTERPPEQT